MAHGSVVIAVASRWRAWVMFAALGSALLLIWQHDWPWFAATAVFLLMPVAARVRTRWAEATVVVREVSRPEPGPVPEPDLSCGGRHRKRR